MFIRNQTHSSQYKPVFAGDAGDVAVVLADVIGVVVGCTEVVDVVDDGCEVLVVVVGGDVVVNIVEVVVVVAVVVVVVAVCKLGLPAMVDGTGVGLNSFVELVEPCAPVLVTSDRNRLLARYIVCALWFYFEIMKICNIQLFQTLMISPDTRLDHTHKSLL